MGVHATKDAAALIALQPDCVVYAASGPDRDAAAVPDYIKLLEAGINVVSTSSTSLVYPPCYFAGEWRDHLQAAAEAGKASLYVSGIFPGFASDQLALLMTTQSKSIRSITVSEVALNDHYPVADVMMDGMGFGRPLDFQPLLKTPGFIEARSDGRAANYYAEDARYQEELNGKWWRTGWASLTARWCWP